MSIIEQQYFSFTIPYNSNFKACKYSRYIASYVEYIMKNDNHGIMLQYIENKNGKNLYEFRMGVGEYKFRYEKHRFKLEIEPIGKPVSVIGYCEGIEIYEETTVHVEHEDKQKAKALFETFMNSAIEYMNSQDIETQLKVYTYECTTGWIRLGDLPKRSLDTIYMESAEKLLIVQDIEDFIKDKSDYHKFGIPYKRAYMFEGKPGTGKSSLIFALASKLDKNICILNLGGIDDDAKLMKAIKDVHDDAILLIEDIDSLFLKRETKCSITFSSLLNILDGMGRKDGMITFITTNYIERLDDALLRPGRIDYIIKFGASTKDQIKQMFETIIPKQKDKFEEFYKKIQHKEIIMSMLQKFLFDNRKNDDIMSKINKFYELLSYHQKLKEWDSSQGALYV